MERRNREYMGMYGFSPVLSQALYDLNSEILTIIPSACTEDGSMINEIQLRDHLSFLLKDVIQNSMYSVIIKTLCAEYKLLYSFAVQEEWDKRYCYYVHKDIVEGVDNCLGYNKQLVASYIDATNGSGNSPTKTAVNRLLAYTERYDLVKTLLEEETGFQQTTPEGRFSKRYQKALYSAVPEGLGYKLNTEELTKVGNIYNLCKYSGDAEYKVRVTNDFDWNDGEYGHQGSCWWGMYGTSRDTLFYYGGYALLLYNTNSSTFCDYDGAGRIWLLPIDDDTIVAFNSYGQELKEGAVIIAKLMQDITGVSWKYGKREFTNEYNCSIPYINGNNSYAIYRGDKPVSHIKVEMSEQSDYYEQQPEYICECCDRALNGDDVMHNDNGNVYCSECYYDRYFSCECCEEEENKDDEHTFEDRNDESFCRRCYNRLFSFTCCECNHDYSDSYDNSMSDEDGDMYCEDCADNYLSYCTTHGLTYRNEGDCPECEEIKEKEDVVEETKEEDGE